MKTNAILLESLTIEQLQQLIGTSIKNGISELHKELETKNYNEELLTREETCKFLKINSSSLWSWTNKGKVKATEMKMVRRVPAIWAIVFSLRLSFSTSGISNKTVIPKMYKY